MYSYGEKESFVVIAAVAAAVTVEQPNVKRSDELKFGMDETEPRNKTIFFLSSFVCSYSFHEKTKMEERKIVY